MNQLLIYAIESSISLALFMTFFYLLLRKDTHHKRNRAYLLLSLFASLVLPLLNIDINMTPSVISHESFFISLTSVIIRPDNSSIISMNQETFLPLIYLGGVLIALISLLFSLISILSLILVNKKSNARVIKLPTKKPSCFSAFGYIFISKVISSEEAGRMICHEMTHIRKNHFFDLFVVACATVIQWFNPAVYFLRRSLEAVHEYEADLDCINNGEEITSYQSLLISASLGTSIPIITNKFSKTSLLKNRIIMMTKKRTGGFASVKMLLAIPMIALIFFAFSCNKSNKEKESTPVLKADSEQITENDENVFVLCEEMPIFPGGDKALLKFITENIKYPATAKEKGIQGKVIIKFCITSTGDITRVTVSRGVDADLDAEAIRVVKALPKFEPGKQGGKPVDVWYSIPIAFQLQ